MSKKLPQLVSEQLCVEFTDRNDAIAREHGKVVSEITNRGMLQSSPAIRSILDLYISELRVRARIALNKYLQIAVLFPVHEAPGNAVDDAKVFLQDQVDIQAKMLLQAMTARPPLKVDGKVSNPSFGINFEQFYADALGRAQTEIEAKLNLWEVKLSNPPSTKVGTTTVKVTGDNNIIQAGIGGAATIELNPAARQQVHEALSQLKDALGSMSTTPDLSPQEVVELINDCDAELGKQSPNRTKLVSNLQAIATSIQAIGALQPAWQVLKDALITMGFSVG